MEWDGEEKKRHANIERKKRKTYRKKRKVCTGERMKAEGRTDKHR